MQVRLVFLTILLAACGGGRSGARGPGGNSPDPTSQANLDPNTDSDGDGATPNQGDCDDTSLLIGPNAVEVANNGRDDDCDGQVDNLMPCDTAAGGLKTADAITQAIGLCDKRFIVSSSMVGPSDQSARDIVPKLGVVSALEGSHMAFLSTGQATTSSGYNPQPGTGLDGFGGGNTHANPVVTLKLPAGTGCGSSPPATVQDYTEYQVKLIVPFNANSISFQSQFFSAEYPEFVCKGVNDRFLVIMDDGVNPPEQIAFDSGMNTISVDNGFFTVCENSSAHPPQTQHCTKPVSDIAGTNFEKKGFDGVPVGGSTGWLTTSAPVVPGDRITLRFIIFDEGDDIYDSAVLLDNFQWLTEAVAGPVTVQ